MKLTSSFQHQSIPLFCLIISIGLIASTFPLNASLWLDETLSAWITLDTFSESVSRSLTYQGQTPLYFSLLWCYRSLVGDSEIIMRLPSLMAALGCLAALYAIAKHYCQPHSAAMAPLILMASKEFHIASMSVRPYVFALLMSLLTILFILKDSQKSSVWHTAIAAASYSICLYLHPVFIVFAPVLVLLVFIETENFSAALKKCLLAILLTLILSLPMLKQMLALASRRSDLFFAANPSLTKLLTISFPPFIIIAYATALLSSIIFLKQSSCSLKNLPKNKLVFLIFWLLLGPLTFYIHANLTGQSLFISRVMLWRLPALAIILTIVFDRMQPLLTRNTMAIAFTVLCVSVYGMRPWYTEDWREVVATATTAKNNKSLIYSGLIELDNLEWVKNPVHSNYLTAPFSVYAEDYKRKIVLPRNPHTAESLDYIQNQIIPNVEDGDRLVTYSSVRHKDPSYKIHDKLIEVLEANGIQVEQINKSKLVQVFRLKPM